MVDHAKEHAAFEGMFPEGRPGAGTVMLWDRGTWELQSGCVDVDAALRDGCLKFTLYGEKIKGNWTLLRIADKQVGERLLWWLIKDTDQFARSLSEPGILDEAPDSVGTGRSLEQIAADWVKGKGKSVSQLELF